MRETGQINRRPGGFSALPIWFVCAFALGMLLRLYFVFFTFGTIDVNIWQQHAEGVNALGLVHYYHANQWANHPPFMLEAGGLILKLAHWSGIPFRSLFRLPFALLDAGTLLLLFLMLAGHPRRLLLATAYWLNPPAILLSAYHGNTDCAVAFFVLLSVWLLSRGRNWAGAAALGIGLWIKLPVILAVPAILLFPEGRRRKLEFLAVLGLTAITSYLPVILIDWQVLLDNVFGYRGIILHTSTGVPIWGWNRVLLPGAWREHPPTVVYLLARHSWKIALGLILLLAWRRRSQRSPVEICALIAASYTLVYAFSENWAFQYFAWALPFWFFLPVWYPVLATLFGGGYIYLLYWHLCGDPWLLGKWDFDRDPNWPPTILIFRDLALLFFLASAFWFLVAPRIRTAFSSHTHPG